MVEGLSALLYDRETDDTEADSVNLPTGRERPGQLELERDLARRLKVYGLRLIPDRTAFTDPHYRGGYMLADGRSILAGRNFELGLLDVMDWLADREQKGKRKRL